MSRTGVPSMASNPSTSSARPSTATTRHIVGRWVWAILAALGENADLRPVLAAARMPGAADDVILRDAIEKINDLDMAEGVEPCQGVGCETGGIKFDPGAAAAPIVVLGFRAPTPDMANRCDTDDVSPPGRGCHLSRRACQALVSRESDATMNTILVSPYSRSSTTRSPSGGAISALAASSTTTSRLSPANRLDKRLQGRGRRGLCRRADREKQG